MTQRLDNFRSFMEAYYQDKNADLLFHGWHHVAFVTDKATALAQEMKQDAEIIAAAALVHDLNYLVEKNSATGAGKELRQNLLAKNGFNESEIQRIESIVTSACTSSRNENISDEAKILSDADTLFKALPTTPIIFGSRYIAENNVDLQSLAHKVASQQRPLIDRDIYFYTPVYKEKYKAIAELGVSLWENVITSLKDPDVKLMLQRAGIEVRD